MRKMHKRLRDFYTKGSTKIDVAYVPTSKAWVSHQIRQLHREFVGTNVGP